MPFAFISGPKSHKTRPVIKESDIQFHGHDRLSSEVCVFAGLYIFCSELSHHL